MTTLLKLFQSLIPLLVSLALSRDTVNPGERISVVLAVHGETGATATLTAPDDWMLESLQLTGSEYYQCGWEDIPEQCIFGVHETNPVLITATYFVTPLASTHDLQRVSAEIHDLNNGGTYRVEKFVRVGLVESPPPIKPLNRIYLPIIL